MRFVSLFFVSLFLLFSACTKTEEPPGPFGKVLDDGTKIKVTYHVTHPWDQWSENVPSWVAPVEPFQVIGNVYYVGTEGLSSFLITSDEGHVLIDGTLPQNVPQIIDNIDALGFDINDVEILLNSHAHFDHSGGLRDLKARSEGKLIASEGDRSALEGGFYFGDEFTERKFAPKVVVDETVEDGDVVKLGDIQLTAHLTPGHSRGCTSWTMPVTDNVTHKGQTYEALFFCSATVAGNRLIPAQYEGIVEDYKTTFEKTRDWHPDIFLSNHPSFFNMKDKREKQKSGDVRAFIDRGGFPTMMKRLEADFTEKLSKAEAKQDALYTRLGRFAFDPTHINKDARYIFYSHGRIIEDQGVPAHSPRFGPYEYVNILETLEGEEFTVISEPRGPDTDVSENARDMKLQIQALLDAKVPASHITIIGASKGAYIASLVSHELANSEINVVLLAGCSQGALLQMIEQDMKLFGRVLTIRDMDDVDLAGSCAPILKTSPGVSDFEEILTQEKLSHGLIYTAHPTWVTPAMTWAKKN